MRDYGSIFWRLSYVILLLISGTVVASDSYTLQPGDILDISVWREDDLQREVLVRPDGGITFPLVGGVTAADRTVDQLTQDIERKIAKYIPEPVVTVSIKQILGNRIYILGKVNKPGEFIMNRNVDVLQALSMAGGLNPFALGDKIQILRRESEGQKSIPFKYTEVKSGKLEQNVLLRAGDIILVP